MQNANSNKDYLTWEKSRNTTPETAKLFTEILREAFGEQDNVVIGHHLTFVGLDGDADEIPSADTLIFDHFIARRIWGEEKYLDFLKLLVVVPVENRDQLLAQLYYNRDKIQSKEAVA